MLCADERYYPNTLKQVLNGSRPIPMPPCAAASLDFIDEHDTVIDSHLTTPFNLPSHLACERVPAILAVVFQSPH